MTPIRPDQASQPRLLLVTGLWPTEDRPSAGTFVRERVRGVDRIKVIAPHSYRGAVGWRYVSLCVRALAARGPFDGVEVHPAFPAGLIGLATARIRRVPLVTYAHGADVRDTARANPLYRRLARMVIRGSATVITNSSDTAAHVEQLGGRAIILPPGVDLERFRPSPRPADRRVLYLGGSEARKGYEVALALADTVAGPGIATVEPEQVPSVMAAHDVVLVPSEAEPFGLIAAEAIASGRWVVASSVGGLRDIVIEGVNGTLVADGDYAGAIARVPDYDPKAVALTARRFDEDEHRRRMAAVWRELLGVRGGTG